MKNKKETEKTEQTIYSIGRELEDGKKEFFGSDRLSHCNGGRELVAEFVFWETEDIEEAKEMLSNLNKEITDGSPKLSIYKTVTKITKTTEKI